MPNFAKVKRQLTKHFVIYCKFEFLQTTYLLGKTGYHTDLQ